MGLDDQLREELTALRGRSRLRDTRSFDGADRVHVRASDQIPLLSFCTNDYLGLASHPALASAATAVMATSGVGAGAARLVSGENAWHRILERSLAALVGKPEALLFPSGYQTNLGVVTALAGPNDLIVSDSANHASIVDGCRLTRARICIYPHCDADAAQAALLGAPAHRRRLLVTESVFSMDGDRAPLAALASAAQRADAILIVDEAHALGVVGPNGSGLAAAVGVTPDVVVGTLGKALGTCGGFAAGSAPLRATLINRARSFIYATAGPPALAAAADAAVSLVTSPVGQELRLKAQELAARARAGLLHLGLPAPGQDLIIPVVLGSESLALDTSAALLERGILVPAIRPPTVPEGTSRLRITISAAHSEEDVDRLLDALASLRPLLLHRPLAAGPTGAPSPFFKET